MRNLLILPVIIILLSACDLFAPPEIQYKVDAGASKEFAAEKNDFLYVSAQVNAAASWVEVSIKEDGDTIDDALKLWSGDYVIATASGTAE